ncbi:hypothetical protein [Phenylobacterium montanum]|uniref:Uncharacterized protein n=1 Tax=Phenylobacterium montanum TaxID=2823693 RepID=A0A975G2D2_9CAUL|nr:hypothetical protein [Caulobacter sp. S6]QUD89509.1 hypothetical protein KCG34_06405 [Caulobacter sp. S6]
MPGNFTETVLLVCSDEVRASDILSKLFDKGIDAIGPVKDSATAMALAGQKAPTLAIIARPPAGRRNAWQLARALMDNWGIASLLLDTARQDGCDGADPSWWRPGSGQLARLKSALG